MSRLTDFSVSKVLAQMGAFPIQDQDEPVTSGRPRKASSATRRHRQAIKAARKYNRPKRHR